MGYGLIFNLAWAVPGALLVLGGIYGWALEPADDDDNPHGHDDHDNHGPSSDDAAEAPSAVTEEAPVG